MPIIPAIPHAKRAFGLFAEAEELLHDPLNRLAHLAVKPLLVVLFLFGLTRGGVDLMAFAPTTVVTLAAFWLFERAGLDFAVLEVGLGGRLDAVNLIDADLQLITSIGLDHA